MSPNITYFLKYFTYLAASGLTCGMRDLSLVACDLVPRPGIEPDPVHWEHGVSATEPPGKPHIVNLY